MKKELIFIVLLLFTTLSGKAQNMTYEHDNQIMNQFTVMELGVGVLRPADYYNTMHKSYQYTAHATNKFLFREKVKTDTKQEVQYSDTIKKVYNKRSKVELLNYASKNPKLNEALSTEINKVNSKMAVLYNNISKIQARGGTSKDHEQWIGIYKCLQNDLNILHKAWITMGDRQKQYITLYKRVVKYNSDLVAKQLEWNGRKQVQKWYSSASKPTRQTRNGTLAFKSLGRWQNACAVHGFSTK